MVVTEILTTSTSLIEEVGKTLLYLQAMGIIILIFLGFQIISYLTNKKRLKKLETFSEEITNINKKLNKIYTEIKTIKKTI